MWYVCFWRKLKNFEILALWSLWFSGSSLFPATVSVFVISRHNFKCRVKREFYLENIGRRGIKTHRFQLLKYIITNFRYFPQQCLSANCFFVFYEPKGCTNILWRASLDLGRLIWSIMKWCSVVSRNQKQTDFSFWMNHSIIYKKNPHINSGVDVECHTNIVNIWISTGVTQHCYIF